MNQDVQQAYLRWSQGSIYRWRREERSSGGVRKKRTKSSCACCHIRVIVFHEPTTRRGVMNNQPQQTKGARMKRLRVTLSDSVCGTAGEGELVPRNQLVLSIPSQAPIGSTFPYLFPAALLTGPVWAFGPLKESRLFLMQLSNNQKPTSVLG